MLSLLAHGPDVTHRAIVAGSQGSQQVWKFGGMGVVAINVATCSPAKFTSPKPCMAGQSQAKPPNPPRTLGAGLGHAPFPHMGLGWGWIQAVDELGIAHLACWGRMLSTTDLDWQRILLCWHRGDRACHMNVVTVVWYMGYKKQLNKTRVQGLC